MKLMKSTLPAAAILGGLLFPIGFAAAQVWVQTSAPTNDWISIASSADGAKLAAAAATDAAGNPGRIYLSTDAGAHWTIATAPASFWNAIASSADGARLAAAVGFNFSAGPIYTSADSGATWTSNNAPLLVWTGIASSADGARLAAAAYSDAVGNAGGIYLSSDAGAHWRKAATTNGISAFTNSYWTSIASSSDGTKLAATAYAGGIWTSADSGSNWTQSAGAPNQSWSSIASSANGSNLVAVVQGGGLWISTDSGVHWTQSASAPDRVNWTAIASSSNASKLAAVASEDEFYQPVPPYVSTNSGTNWTATVIATNQYNSATNPAGWQSIASSADGGRLAAAINGGGIFTLQSAAPPPALPTLNIAVSGTNLVLSWSAGATGVVLQQNSNLSTTNWTDVAVPPVETNGLFEVILPLPRAGNDFYRLSSQSSSAVSPVLRIARSGGRVVLSWPATATGFGLQQNPSLATPNWTAVTNSVVVTNGENRVTVTPSSGGDFYRLKSQP